MVATEGSLRLKTGVVLTAATALASPDQSRRASAIFIRRPFGAVTGGPVSIPAGGSAKVNVRTPFHPKARALTWRLDNPPDGIVLESAEMTKPGLLSLTLAAAAEGLEPGFCDNLIVAGYTERSGKGKGGKKHQIHVGVLPAIPVKIAP